MMRRAQALAYTLVALCGLLSFLPSPVSAQDATLQEVVATLEQGYAGLKDMQASFNQTTTLPGLPKPQKGHGELSLRRPQQGAAQFRFDYAKPKQLIVSNGKQAWFYQPENRQVIVTSMDAMLKSGGSLAMSYLTGLGNVSRDFSAAFGKPARDRQNNYIIDLTPRKPSPALAKLRLAISNEAVEKQRATGTATAGFPIIFSVVMDAHGTETRIDYSKVRTNSGLSAGRFSFKAPEGTEIIQQ